MPTLAKERIVYEHRAEALKPTRKGRRAARRSNGLMVGVVFAASDGTSHRYLNCGIPTKADGAMVAPMDKCVCKSCGYGYSELMSNHHETCSECRWDRLVRVAKVREHRWGVYLGFSAWSEHLAMRARWIDNLTPSQRTAHGIVERVSSPEV